MELITVGILIGFFLGIFTAGALRREFHEED